MDIDGINQLVNEMDRDSKAIKSELFKMCWYMRGGMTISEAYMTDTQDREIIAKLIEDNLATTKETQLPFF
jgi:hypothetical protein